MCVCVCVCACVRACVCVWMSACLCACLCTYVCRVSFRKMGKGGAKQYLQNKWGGGGGKGSACDSAPSRGSGDMTRFLLLISRITFFGGESICITVSICNVQL